MAESLIDTPERQPSLPMVVESPETVAVDSRNPEFTAARFFAREPEKYRAIATLLGEGVSHAAIARAMSVSRNTVAAIYGREHKALPVEQARLKACQEYGELAGLCRERARDMLLDEDATFTPQGLGVLMGVAQDKAIALSGGTPVRVDVHVHRDDVGELIERAREKMRLGGETGAANGDPAGTARDVTQDVGAVCLEDQVAPAGPAAVDGTPTAGSEFNEEVH